MKLSAVLTLLAVVALLTPIAAIFGLYDSTFDQVARFAAPAIGALSAVSFAHYLNRRRARRA